MIFRRAAKVRPIPRQHVLVLDDGMDMVVEGYWGVLGNEYGVAQQSAGNTKFLNYGC